MSGMCGGGISAYVSCFLLSSRSYFSSFWTSSGFATLSAYISSATVLKSALGSSIDVI